MTQVQMSLALTCAALSASVVKAGELDSRRAEARRCDQSHGLQSLRAAAGADIVYQHQVTSHNHYP
jgi:hypothetical protein